MKHITLTLLVLTTACTGEELPEGLTSLPPVIHTTQSGITVRSDFESPLDLARIDNYAAAANGAVDGSTVVLFEFGVEPFATCNSSGCFHAPGDTLWVGVSSSMDDWHQTALVHEAMHRQLGHDVDRVKPPKKCVAVDGEENPICTPDWHHESVGWTMATWEWIYCVNHRMSSGRSPEGC